MALTSQFPGCCSVRVLYLFSDGITPRDADGLITGGGSGRFVAIIGEHQKGAYDKLCKKYTLESQSHPFMGNHNRRLIVCVFKRVKDKVKK